MVESQFYVLFVCLSIGGVGIGIVLPALDALITEGIEKEQCGTITSFYSSMRFIGVALGPQFTHFLWIKETPSFLFYRPYVVSFHYFWSSFYPAR